MCVWRGGGRALSSCGAPGNRAGWASGGGGERAAAGCPVCARAEWARAGRGRPEPKRVAARSGRAGRAEPSAVARCGAASVDELGPLGAQPRAASAAARGARRAARSQGRRRVSAAGRGGLSSRAPGPRPRSSPARLGCGPGCRPPRGSLELVPDARPGGGAPRPPLPRGSEGGGCVCARVSRAPAGLQRGTSEE